MLEEATQVDTEYEGCYRGGDTQEAELEDVVNEVFGNDFMQANGLRVPEDEAEVEDPSCSQSARWSDQRLDTPVHSYTKVTVRELVYTLMKICAGAVKATQMDEIIKTFKRTLPDGNNMPGYIAIPLRALHITRSLASQNKLFSSSCELFIT